MMFAIILAKAIPIINSSSCYAVSKWEISHRHFLTSISLSQFIYCFQLGFNTVFSALLAIPYARAGSTIVNQMRQNSVWQMMFLFSAFVFAANMLLIPIENAVIDSATQAVYMLLMLAAILFLFLLMHMIFYFTVSEITAQEKAEARSRFWESQESQFIAQQRYMKETDQVRHDFRQSIRTLTGLYDAGDHEAVGRYIYIYILTHM